jgi:hypothetical protein
MRLSIGAAGLLAAAAVWLLASPARAEFALQIKQNGGSGNGFRIDEKPSGGFTVTTFGSVKKEDVSWKAVDGGVEASATVGGYTFQVTGQSNREADPTPSMGVVSFNAKVTANDGAGKTSFSYFVADSPFTFPGTPDSTVYLTASVFTTTDPGLYTAGNLVQTQGHYTAFGPSTTTAQYVTTTAGPLNGANQTAHSNTVEIAERGALYTLSDLGGVIEVTGSGSVSFWAQAVTAMPEPTGLVVALVGLPCMALVVRAARRRAAKAPAIA